MNSTIIANRMKLAPYIRKFHLEAQTLSSNVNAHIDLLRFRDTVVLASTHQPNLFPYGGVYKKIVLLETLKRKMQELDPERRIVSLFIVIDHEFADDRWICHAQLPDVRNRTGLLQLKCPVMNGQKRWIVKNVDRPSSMTLDQWRRQIRSWIKETRPPQESLQQGTDTTHCNLPEILDNFDRFWVKVESAHSKAKSIADFNSFLVSEIINNVFGYSTLFIRASELSPAVEEGIKYLISNFQQYSHLLRNTERTLINHGIDTKVSKNVYESAPIWLHCNCGSKAPVTIVQEAYRTVLRGNCLSCKRILEKDLGNFQALDLSGDISDLSLRAVPIPILLARDLGVSCMVTGTGGLGYVTDSAVISRNLSIPFPLIVMWVGRDIYNGISQSAASELAHEAIDETRVTIDKLMQDNLILKRKILELVGKKIEMVREKMPIDTVLRDIRLLKEAQDKLQKHIESVQKATQIRNLAPCFLDYAVNFGLGDIEPRWRNHLLKVGNLTSPIYLDRDQG